MEDITLDLDNLEPIRIDFSDPTPNTRSAGNFGSGIELLMNDKVKSSNNATTIDMKDLDNLENELNDLSSSLEGTKPAVTAGSSSSGETRSFGGFSSFFGGNNAAKTTDNIKIITEDDAATDSHIGKATAESMGGNTKTWDGYSKMSDVPPNMRGSSFPSANMSDREKRRKKRSMLRSLDEWYEKGILKSSTNFTMDSSYEEIEDEYEGALEDKRKRDAVKLQQNWLITAINTIEYGNGVFNPFDINLDGWGESVSEDIDSYNEIFEQLHDKYKGGKMSPELALLLKLGFSASVVHFTNRTLSTAAPGVDDVMRQNPELMRMFTNATVDVMKKSSPGMSFASELLNNNRPTTMTGPPPVPVETRNQAPQQNRPGMTFTQPTSNRPDISMGRGAMFQEGGMDVNQGFQNVNVPPPQSRSMIPPQPSQFQQAQTPQQAPQQRIEMNGPKLTDIDSILSGLKTKTVDIRSSAPLAAAGEPMSHENDSMISITSLKDLQNSAMPKKSYRRKPRSDKNVVSLDI
jgi:hypothetical protein